MKNLSGRSAYSLPLIAIVGLLCLWPTVTFSQVLQNSGIEGTEFVVAVPPNEMPLFPVSRLEIYVASRFDGEIELRDVLSNVSYKKKVTGGNVLTLSDRRNETNWNWEIRDFEQVLQKGIIITSTVPISVYVMNSKSNTSDGYVAFPTNTWGKEYIVTTYFDFKEAKDWAGGFTVVGAEDNTEVVIDLRGVGETLAQTSGGKTINQNAPFTITLNRGEVYTVCGDGRTRGVFDLTGTLVKADKPIGVINHHMRTTMPNKLINGNGRDHLCEWANPVHTWSKEVLTVPLSRKNSNSTGYGDVFRIVASEPNTSWNVSWYDDQGKPAGDASGVLVKAGEFAEFYQVESPQRMIDGPAKWTADKPIQIVQYGCSASFDGDANLDPFQILPSGKNQYVQSVIFQTPTDSKFTKHFLSLVVKVPPGINQDSVTKSLNSVTLNGGSVFQTPANTVTTGKFPEEDCYWARVELGTDNFGHVLECANAVSFGGYVYGYGMVDSYGWGLGGSQIQSESDDSVSPVISVRVDPSTNMIHITTNDNGGVSLVQLFVLDSLGTKVLFTSPTARYAFSEKNRLGTSSVQIPTYSSDVQLLIKARDWAGNEATHQLWLPGARAIVETDSASLDFGPVDAGSSKVMSITLRNVGTAASKSAASVNTPYFRVESNPQFTILPGDSAVVQVRFSPPMHLFGLQFDTLNVIAGLGNMLIPLKGEAFRTSTGVDDEPNEVVIQNATDVTVVSVTGAVLQHWQADQSNAPFTITELPAGVYLMVLKNDSATKFRKLILW